MNEKPFKLNDALAALSGGVGFSFYPRILQDQAKSKTVSKDDMLIS